MSARATIIFETREMTIAVVDSYCLGRWRLVPDLAAMREMGDAVHAWTQKKQKPFVAINVVDIRSLVQVSDELRKEIAKVQEQNAAMQLGLATVIPERGFFAAAVRGVVGAVQLISRAKFPQRVFASVDDAAAWGITLLAKDNTLTIDDVKAIFADLTGPPQ